MASGLPWPTTLAKEKTGFGEHGTVAKVDADAEKAALEDGQPRIRASADVVSILTCACTVVSYGSLISTIPVDFLARSLGDE